ncbi:MAG: 4Fe-4S dicluster domain-containing protein [Anaerosomatales bacterium]|nr:4Fe-4S dicluster domain-containing protein [Anaerosomatales bacterium]
MADTENGKAPEQAAAGVSRRQFLTGIGGLGVGALLGGVFVNGFLLPEEVVAIPASDGYLLVDTKKCGGCESCMLACSLVHTGRSNINLSRIQVTQNPFNAYPNVVDVVQCRQCPYPSCVDACPTGAMHADAETGVRMVDEAKCIGCERCVNACPFTPSRVQWNYEDGHAQKCDLCANTPYWNEEGGADGKQACVAVCPHNAISFTPRIPVQTDDGYQVNLRNAHWGNLMYPTT